MAGSYLHVVENDGSLSSNEDVVAMLENGGDVYEAIEEMYGMIWYLADQYSRSIAGHGGYTEPGELVQRARDNYQIGIEASPGQRFD